MLALKIKTRSESEKLMADMNKRIEKAGERRNKRLSLTPERVPVRQKNVFFFYVCDSD